MAHAREATRAPTRSPNNVVQLGNGAISQDTTASDAAAPRTGTTIPLPPQQQEQADAQMRRVGLAATEMAERGLADFRGAVSSGSVMTMGLHHTISMWRDFARTAWKQQVKATQELMRCRTLSDVIRMQTDFMHSTFEDLLASRERATKLSAAIALSAAVASMPPEAAGRHVAAAE